MIKSLKATLIGLFVVGAVTLSAICGLTYDKAVLASNEATFAMADGASVRLAGNKSDKSGIRWVANINETYYNSLNVGEQDVEFGAVVTPARNLAANEKLTIDSKQAVAVACKATKPAFDENGEFTFYASVVYDDLSEEQKQTAYALELVARAYVKVGETYNYVDEYSTTRSMRAIALTAVLSNKYTAEQVGAYYGNKAINKVNENTGYYGNVDKNGVLENNNLSGTVQAYLGAEPVNAVVGENGITISDIEALEPQKSYTLNIFAENGEIYVQPFIAATKVIRTAEDLAYFELKDITKVQGKSIKSATVFDGYYVVANDIDASSYTHQAVKDETLRNKLNYKVDENGDVALNNNGKKTLDSAFYSTNEVKKYEDRAIRGGLEGVFDGDGHKISNLTVSDQGLFGLVSSGTIKNIAFDNVTLKGTDYDMNVCLIAQNVSDGKFDNVYVKANTIYGGELQNEQPTDARGNRALIATQLDGFYCFKEYSETGKDRWAKTEFTNCVFEYSIASTKAQYCGSYGLYSADTSYSSDKTTSFNNVYIISNVSVSFNNPGKVIRASDTRVVLAENEATTENKLEKAKELIESEGKFNNETAKTNFADTQVFVADGIKRYTSVENMSAAKNDYSSFNGLYWSASEDGALSWKA